MATYGEIAWEDDFGGSNGGEKKSNNKDSWLRLEEGSNVVRLVTRPHQYIVHKGVKKKGDKGFGQKISCSNPDGKGSCPLCDAGLKAGQRWFLGVIEDKTKTYKILDISYQVYSQIRKLARNTEVWGDPTKYNIDICVDKNGGPTGYYSVQPIPHKPLSPDAQVAKDKADLEELKRKVLPPTLEQVQKRLEKILDGGDLDIPAAQPAKAGSKSGAVKKAVQPQVTVEDDDNVEDIFPSYDGSNA